MTSTGITAYSSDGGPSRGDRRAKAEQLAAHLGLPHWNEHHGAYAFQHAGEHQSLVRNLLSSGDTRLLGFRWIRAWMRSRSLTVDAYVYTGLAKVVTVSPSGQVVQSRHDLKIRPETSLDAAKVDRMLSPPRLETPALVIERELANIAWRYDGPTAELTALVLEYRPSHRQGVDLLAAPKIRD